MAAAHRGVRFSRNLLWSYLAWSASAFAPLVTVPFCVRYLGHRIYGEWLVILSLTSYLGLANLGIAQTAANQIAETRARRRYAEAKAVVATSFWAYAMVAIVLIALLPLGALLTVRTYPRASHEVLFAGVIYAGLISLALPCKIYQAALRGCDRVDHEQALEAGATLARTAVTAAALAVGFKLMAIALINGGASLLGGMLAWPLASRAGGDLRPLASRFSPPLMRAMMRPSLAFLALQAGASLTLGVDNLVIGAILGGAAVTRYAVPFRLIWMASLIFTVAFNAALPAITGDYALARRAALARYYVTAMRLAVLFATSGVILLWTTGPSLIRLWAGAGVFPGDRVFAMQLVLFAILVGSAPSIAILNATTSHYRYAAITILEGLLNLLLSLLCVRRYGLAGVIGGTIVASLLTTAWYVSFAAPAVIGLARRRLPRELAPAALAAIAALGLSTVIRTGAGPFATAAGGPGVAAIFAAAYFALILRPDERHTIRRLLCATLARRPRTSMESGPAV